MTSVYAATKGAIVAMARSWASALAVRRIRVNVLVPGPIETNFRNFMPDEARREFEEFVLSRVPLARVGSAEEAAAVALFLLSDDASYVTGSQYSVDGGLTMR
ncbi:SDR family oxidoreductase [Mesorhizobium sp.]|uniref:SDR family NAD(P)-dependent oxidoreductase n=1 Tax=Mesorhizobium sp. TaxID=1871066 RepID=UPI0025FCA827|nr:SDR family oxidoreductase [Mesorhizobium sp.]